MHRTAARGATGPIAPAATIPAAPGHVAPRRGILWRIGLHRSARGLSADELRRLVDAQASATRPIISGVILSGALILAIAGLMEAFALVPGIGYPWWTVELMALVVGALAVTLWQLHDWRHRLWLALLGTLLVGVFLSLPLPGHSGQLAIRTSLFELLPIALLALYAERVSTLSMIAVMLGLAWLRVALHGDPVSGSAMYWLYEGTAIGFGLLIGAYRMDFAVATFRMRLRLRQQATTDELTRSLNRTGWNAVTPDAYATATARHAPVSFAFFDIDLFKCVNDSHGHDAGDRILQGLGAILAEHLGTGSHCARFGGEEFVAMFIDLQPGEVEACVEQVRVAFAAWSAGIAAVTISAGVAHHRPGDTMAQQLRRADMALYAAKAQGRDRLVVADQAKHPHAGGTQ
jgi:diguanylate cyclase (GGDEF)-like protein